MPIKFNPDTIADAVEHARRQWCTLASDYVDHDLCLQIQRRECDGWYRVCAYYDYTANTVFASPSLKCVVAEANRWLAKHNTGVNWMPAIVEASNATRERCNRIGVSV